MVQRQGHAVLFQAYTQSKWTPVSSLSFNAGIHAQYFHLNQKKSIEPRFGMKYILNDRHSLALAYGLHSRIERLPVYFVVNNDARPNQNIDLMKSAHYVLSYHFKLSDHIRLCVEPYYQVLSDVPVGPDSYISTLNIQNDIFFNDRLVSRGKGRNAGIDFTLERFLHEGFYWLLTDSVFDSKYTDALSVTRNTRFNKNYVLNLLAGKEWAVGQHKNNRVNVNLRFNCMGGNRRDVVNQSASLHDKDVVYGETGRGLAYDKQTSATPVFSFSISYRQNKPGYSSVWALQVINAGGAREFSNDYYDLNEKKVKARYEGVIVPNLSYRIEF